MQSARAGASYRMLETRAIEALPRWTVLLAVPEQAMLPDVRMDQGMDDGMMLDVAAWVSARKAREIRVDRGTLAQRRAVAASIVPRRGRAVGDVGARAIRLGWEPRDMAEPQSSDGADRPDGARR